MAGDQLSRVFSALADPTRRAALGIADMRKPAAHQAALCSFALAWFSCRAVSRLQELVLACRFDERWVPPSIAVIGGFEACLGRSVARRIDAAAELRAFFDDA